MSSDKNASAPVIDWDSAPEGFPVWIEDLVPFGESTSCWAKDEGSYFLGVNGSKWDKPCDVDFSVHHRTQVATLTVRDPIDIDAHIRLSAEAMFGKSMAREMFPGAYVVKGDPSMSAELLEQLRESMEGRQGSGIVLLEPAPVVVDWSEAPEGATHRVPGGCWYKFDAEADTLSCWLLGDWSESPAENYERTGSVFVNMIARPTGPAEKWSLDGKDGNWNYDTLAELVIDNYGHDSDGDGHPASYRPGPYEGDTIYRGIACFDDPVRFLPEAHDILDHMADATSDSDASEYADNYPDINDKARAALEVALEPLKAWARKHCQPDFFTVKGVTPYILTVEDVRAAKAQERAR